MPLNEIVSALFFRAMTISVRGKILMLAAVVLSLPFADWSAETKARQRDDEIDRIFASLRQPGAPGAAVLVKKDGKIVLRRNYGLRDLRNKVAIDSQTNFRLASCTKQFTAMAIMLLVHDGKMRYDQRLTDIFSEFPNYGRDITIRNLLNHTSGLPDYEELMERIDSGKNPQWTESYQISDAQVLKLLEEQSSGKFSPGAQWSYSNSGYVVLGLIVAKVSGKPFEDFLQERIFKPLEMNHTLAYVSGKNQVTRRAYGHSKEGNVFRETDQSATSATLGDGGVYSNVEDLAKWDDAVNRHTLLSAVEMQPALIPVKLADGSEPHWASGPGDTDPQAGKPVSYGFGWFLDAYNGHARIWHFGDTMGFKTAIERFEEHSVTIILLANRSDLDAEQLASRLAELYIAAEK
jgi:CubicO group peptidase (beta-lactamase class C family)